MQSQNQQTKPLRENPQTTHQQKRHPKKKLVYYQ